MALTKKYIWKLVDSGELVDVPLVTPPIGKPTGKYHLASDPASVTDETRTTLISTDTAGNMVVGDLKPLAHDWSRVLPAEMQPKSPERPSLAALDHPCIGGKFTVFVLCYGDRIDLAKRCVGSILDHAPASRIDLRVALNQPSPEVLDYFYGFPSSVITKLYVDTKDRRKYPAMREMFYDANCPIKTNYLLWFDDDSHVIDTTWLEQLAKCITENHLHGSRLYGVKYLHDLMQFKHNGFNPEKWFQAADWWRHRWMHIGDGTRIANNGHIVSFVSGGFWALSVAAMREANIPDVRLNHNGGDITIGEQIHQTGYKIKDFCRGKKPVRYSDAIRRGYREDFPWSKVV